MARQKVDDLQLLEIYNSMGKSAAIEEIHTTYGVRDAYHVLRRLKSTEAYRYNQECDCFDCNAETPFMELDELCVKTTKKELAEQCTQVTMDSTAFQFEDCIQALIKERFVEYARFIQSNSIDRIWRINKTALKSAGYKLEIY